MRVAFLSIFTWFALAAIGYGGTVLQLVGVLAVGSCVAARKSTERSRHHHERRNFEPLHLAADRDPQPSVQRHAVVTTT